MRSTLLFATMAVAACQGPGIDEDLDTDVGTNIGPDEEVDDIDTSCTATVTSTDPADGHTSFPTTLPLTATFSEAVTDAQFSMSVSGVGGRVELADNGLSATFTPGAPLATSTDYTLTVSVCSDTRTVGFRTAAAPLEQSALIGRTYTIDMDDVQWLAPAGASLFADQIPVEYILLHIEDANTATAMITPVASTGMDDGAGNVIQDACQEPYGFGEQDFSTNPVFRVGPTTFTFEQDTNTISVDNAFVEATFVEGGAAIEDVTISGQLDTRPFDAYSFSGDLCTDAAFLGATCVACAADGAVECLDALLFVDRAPDDADLVFTPDLVPGSGC